MMELTLNLKMLKKHLILAFSFIFFLFVFVSSSFASTLSLSPQISTVTQGKTFSVEVRLNTNGESINGASAYLSYPKDLLTVSYINYGSSAFPILGEESYGEGSIRISRGSISGVVGNSVSIATIGFVGKSIGTATVLFINGSAVPKTSDSSDSLDLGESSVGRYTVELTLKESMATGVTDITKPIIKNISVTYISTNNATVTWETDEESDSTLEYGLSSNRYFLSTSDKTLARTHILKLEEEVLTPGVLLHFRVKSKDKTGNEGASEDSTLQLIGHNILIKALDAMGSPVNDSQVLLYPVPQKGRTNSSGEVSFANVTEGKHIVVIKAGFTEKTGEIVVNESFATQSFTLTFDTTSNKLQTYIFYLIGAVILIIIASKKIYKW